MRGEICSPGKGHKNAVSGEKIRVMSKMSCLGGILCLFYLQQESDHPSHLPDITGVLWIGYLYYKYL